MITDNEFKKQEKKYINMFFDNLRSKSEKYVKCTTEIEKNCKQIGCNINIVNGVIRTNNKIVDLSHEFENAGISMFAEKMEFNNGSWVSSSTTGFAIIDDLVDYLGDTTDSLNELARSVTEVGIKKIEKASSLTNMNPVSLFFLKVRSFFIKPNFEKYDITDEDREIVYKKVEEYNKKIDKITNYSLKENLVDAVIKSVNNGNIDKWEALRRVPGDMEKLGLNDQIPKLDEEIRKIDDEEIYRKKLELLEECIGKKTEIDLDGNEASEEFNEKEPEKYIEKNNKYIDFKNNLNANMSLEEQRNNNEIIQEKLKINEEKQNKTNTNTKAKE